MSFSFRISLIALSSVKNYWFFLQLLWGAYIYTCNGAWSKSISCSGLSWFLFQCLLRLKNLFIIHVIIYLYYIENGDQRRYFSIFWFHSESVIFIFCYFFFKVCVFDLKTADLQTNDVLVIGSDGLWDLMSIEEVYKSVNNVLQLYDTRNLKR